MSEPAKESDALAIARWCWPEKEWLADSSFPIARDSAWFCASRFDDDADSDRTQGPSYGVAAAERVLIERGHAEAYGRALYEADLDLYPADRNGEPYFDALVRWATLPFDARVRAMAAVIRALPTETPT